MGFILYLYNSFVNNKDELSIYRSLFKNGFYIVTIKFSVAEVSGAGDIRLTL